ncbi:MAG: zinc-binding dehydrogenase [Clostridia bacterium]|nr:zinc-binding dehydrogenase [Clostridia bacterium]
MINQVIKLVAPRRMETFFKEENIDDNSIVVRPRYLSICAADQRYYTGSRAKEILDKKLPLALIHEAVGEVLFDKTGEFKSGDNVVMIPNTPFEQDEVIKENYLRSSKFRSSSYDGFLQNVVLMRKDRVIKIGDIDLQIASLLEPISICVNAIEEFLKTAHKRRNIIGVWGCGTIGYLTTLLLKKYLPDSRIIIFGTNTEKMRYFSFVDEQIMINEVPEDLKIDHAFECVGGPRSEDAIKQMIKHINPQGTISLLGVSENPVPIETRMVLEKGLKLIGDSRSGYQDFYKAVEIMQDKKMQDYVENIIMDMVEVNNLNDIYKAFDLDLNNSFKTVMKWNI